MGPFDRISKQKINLWFNLKKFNKLCSNYFKILDVLMICKIIKNFKKLKFNYKNDKKNLKKVLQK